MRRTQTVVEQEIVDWSIGKETHVDHVVAPLILVLHVRPSVVVVCDQGTGRSALINRSILEEITVCFRPCCQLGWFVNQLGQLVQRFRQFFEALIRNVDWIGYRDTIAG